MLKILLQLRQQTDRVCHFPGVQKASDRENLKALLCEQDKIIQEQVVPTISSIHFCSTWEQNCWCKLFENKIEWTTAFLWSFDGYFIVSWLSLQEQQWVYIESWIEICWDNLIKCNFWCGKKRFLNIIWGKVSKCFKPFSSELSGAYLVHTSKSLLK